MKNKYILILCLSLVVGTGVVMFALKLEDNKVLCIEKAKLDFTSNSQVMCYLDSSNDEEKKICSGISFNEYYSYANASDQSSQYKRILNEYETDMNKCQ